MNTTLSEGEALVQAILATRKTLPKDVEIIFFTPHTHLWLISGILNGHYQLGAQDCSAHTAGAYTGEVSAAMIASTGASYTLIGHSERRQYHHETNELLLEKMHQAFNAGLKVIFCVGEPLEVREKGDNAAWEYVEQQLRIACKLTAENLTSLIIAYEPIWAIGTGQTATPEEASRMCDTIEQWSKSKLKLDGKMLPVLYGGSCNANNAQELFAQKGISGGLIGGASLKAEDFLSIIRSF